MNKRSQARRQQQVKRFWILMGLLTFIGLVSFLLGRAFSQGDVTLTNHANKDLAALKEDVETSDAKTARVVANGDILLHNVLYTSAYQPDGSYDFKPYFSYVKDWISRADLAIGDYEGTISPDFPLAGYPLFNAPKEIADTLKETGYDVIDLAHNHILDSQLSGALNTVTTFEQLGLSTIGIYTEDRAKQSFLIKEVNGIKIAILAYAYGYNGMEGNLTAEEYQKHLSDFDKETMREEIRQAEKMADVTIVMPQMGVEYALEPNEEQVSLYHDMIEWGADVIFGGHPHVVEPAEIVTHDGERKLIIYSMGNFISNQTYEMMGDYWPERGLLMDVTFEKKGGKTTIKTAKAHPTMVWTWGKGTYEPPYYYEHQDYRVLVLEDFIKGGKYRDDLPTEIQEKVDIAYKEMTEHVHLNWD